MRQPAPDPNASICCCICFANSRVGVIINAYIPYGSEDRMCSSGNTNEAVLPDPVADNVSK